MPNLSAPSPSARADHLRAQLFAGLGEMAASGADEETTWRWIVGMVYAIVALTMPEAVSR
jgi:hypothetical protein